MSSSKIAMAVIVAAALLVAGCGSSKSGVTDASTTASTASSTTAANTSRQPAVTVIHVATGKPLSRAEWIKRGEAICTRLNAQLAANPVKTPQEIARLLPVVAADERIEAEKLAKLVPPASERTHWQEVITGTEQWAADSEQLGHGAESGQFSLRNPLAAATQRVHEALATVAKKAGFKECALL